MNCSVASQKLFSMRRLFAILMAAIILVCMPGYGEEVVQDSPNIIVIMADDMGYSDLGCMGGDAETPNLDALARDGILFPDFYNNAKCAPTRASLMTGMSNQRTGAYHGAGDVKKHGGMTIAEALRSQYTTLMVDKWHIKPEALELGFERYFGSPLSAIFFWPTDEKDAGKMKLDDAPYTEKDMSVPLEDWYLSVEDTNHAIKFLQEEVVDKGRNKPFFMYYASHNPHWPLQALREDTKRYEKTFLDGTDVARKRRYDRMVRMGIIDPKTCKLPGLEEGTPSWDELSDEEKVYYQKALAIHTAMVYRMDLEIGRLFDYLKKNNLFDNTAIFFMSDNGASAEGSKTIIPPGREMGDRGTHSRLNDVGASVCNTPLRKYKSTLNEGGCSTPMIFHWPKGIGKPGRISRQVGHVYDIFPTVLEIAGIDYPTTYDSRSIKSLDGISLWPLIRDDKEVDRTICLSYERHRSVRMGSWKALRQMPRGDKPVDPWQLYDLGKDRSETNNIAANHPELIEAMDKIWAKWSEDVGALHKKK